MELFKPVTPPAPPHIDLILGDVKELLERLHSLGETSPLFIADPPWTYANSPGTSFNPETAGIYKTLTMEEIAETLAAVYQFASPGARLVVWTTYPQLGDWMSHAATIKPWRYVTGGTWNKTGRSGGVGFHCLGRCEPVLLYRRGGPLVNKWDQLANSWTSTPGPHSEKPWEWMAKWITRWTAPGDLVIDLYSGMAPLARACYATGRRYMGAEIDPDRWHLARCKLGQFRCKFDGGFYGSGSD